MSTQNGCSPPTFLIETESRNTQANSEQTMVVMASDGPSPHPPSLRLGFPAPQPSRRHHAQSLLGPSIHSSAAVGIRAQISLKKTQCDLSLLDWKNHHTKIFKSFCLCNFHWTWITCGNFENVRSWTETLAEPVLVRFSFGWVRKEEERIGVTSDVVKVKDEDPTNPDSSKGNKAIRQRSILWRRTP